MTTKVIQAIWLASCAAVFILCGNSAEPEAWWLMILLTFPVGLLVTLAWGWTFYASWNLFSVQLPAWVALSFALGVIAAGFWQWFWLVPRIVRRMRRAF